jgi:hypothetical protein
MGITPSEILSVMNTNVNSVDDLERALMAANPDDAQTIGLIFDRYR